MQKHAFLAFSSARTSSMKRKGHSLNAQLNVARSIHGILLSILLQKNLQKKKKKTVTLSNYFSVLSVSIIARGERSVTFAPSLFQLIQRSVLIT
uniref:Uncharacterized protein n=1 Tax=Caenorhabditis japonica TaxID=281687 RepID=A0A8R1IM96_CAEJA